MALGLIGIIVGLLLFLFLVYKGCSPYWTAIVCALIVAVTNLEAGQNVFDQLATAITDSFLGGVMTMISALFAVIFMGSIMGRLYGASGAAESIAKTLINVFVIKRQGKAQVAAAIIVLWFVAAVCTMGGIDGYVLTFTLLPICLIVCEMCDIPRRFIPAMFCLNCAFMVMPGAPQIYNIMSEAALKSTIPGFVEQGAFGIVDQLSEVSSTSALVPGIVGAGLVSILGVITLIYMINKAKGKGEHFEYGPVEKINIPDRKLPNFFVSLIPLLVVFIVYTIIGLHVFIALVAGTLVGFIILFPNIPKVDRKGKQMGPLLRLKTVLNEGADGYPGALLSVSTPAGLAGVITATSAFGMIVGMLAGIDISPIVLTIIVVCIIVAITSAPPTALMVALPIVVSIVAGGAIAMAPDVAAATLPVSPHAIMRVGALAASTFETLPINGLIILGLALAKTTHKESYKPMFLMTVVYTLIGTVVAALLCTIPGLA